MAVKRVLVATGVVESWTRSFLEGIVKFTNLQGNWALHSPFDYRDPLKDLSWAVDRDRYDGLIVNIPNKTVAKRIVDSGIPAIASYDPDSIGLSSLPNVTRFVWDDVSIAEMAAEYLLSFGFEHYAFCSLTRASWSQTRFQVLLRQIEKEGHDVFVYQRTRSRIQQLVNWLIALPKPIGLMIPTDFIAPVVYEACKIANIVIPDQIAIVGASNDDLICNLSDPPLSSIIVNSEATGYKAALTLDKMMKGENVNTNPILIRPLGVVPRRSTEIVLTEDTDVAKAVAFIRDSSRHLIQVADVSAFVSVSRRTLERKFKKFFGRSINDEIRRVRLKQLLQLLSQTNLTIEEIAYNYGYTNSEPIFRLMKKEMNMTPNEYRQKCVRNTEREEYGL